MPTLKTLYPEGEDLLKFLRAPIGEDVNGATVSVRSALARLGCDPLREAGDLSELTALAAEKRLAGLLADFDDVPSLSGQHAALAQALVLLLPDGRMRRRLVSPKAWHGMDLQQVAGSVNISKIVILAAVLGLIALLSLDFLPARQAPAAADGALPWQPSPVIAAPGP